MEINYTWHDHPGGFLSHWVQYSVPWWPTLAALWVQSSASWCKLAWRTGTVTVSATGPGVYWWHTIPSTRQVFDHNWWSSSIAMVCNFLADLLVSSVRVIEPNAAVWWTSLAVGHPTLLDVVPMALWMWLLSSGCPGHRGCRPVGLKLAGGSFPQPGDHFRMQSTLS